jgi:hypothetical protein
MRRREGGEKTVIERSRVRTVGTEKTASVAALDACAVFDGEGRGESTTGFARRARMLG